MKYIKSYLRWAVVLTVFGIGGALLILVSFLPPERMRYRMASMFARLLLRIIGSPLQVEGTYPSDRPHIVMTNHASLLDAVIVAAAMRDCFTSIVAIEQMRYPIWGTLVRRFKGIPIQRKNRETAIESIKIAEQRLRDGMYVAILPEGTRTLTGKMGPLKKGGFHMAMNTGAPIQIAGIEGAFYIKAKTSSLLTPGKLVLRFGKVIQPEQYEHMTMEEVMEEVRQELLVLSGEVPATT